MDFVAAMNRIMMHLEGEDRPLSMGGNFTSLPAEGTARWSGLPVERHRMEPWEGDAEIGPLSGEHGVLVYASGAAEIHTTVGGRDVSRRVTAGCVRVMSGNDRSRFRRILGQADVIVVHLPAEWIARALGEAGANLFDRTASVDQGGTLAMLAGEMWSEVNRRGTTGQLFAETLSLAFLSYAGARLGHRALHPRGRAFTRAESERLREFISSRFRDDVSLTDLASVVGLRPRHFSELFSRAFGCSPYRFVLNQRLSEAARLLATTELDVAEVAYEMGFCSQSHFTAMFRRSYGVTPGQYVTDRRRAVS